MENNEEKTPEEASNMFHNIMKASVSEKDWYQVHDNYKLHPGTVPATNEAIIIRDGVTQEDANFLPFDGIHFMVKTKHSKALLLKSNYTWRRL